MRQVIVFAPADRSDDVVEALQEALYAEGRISRSTQDGISTIMAVCARENSGKVLHALDKIGCGVAWGRVVLVPIAMIKPLPKATISLETLQKEWDIQSLWMQSASARMAIEEIYLQVDDGSRLSFDYVLYILVAACIATLGLATNNTVMIVASMLLSPLMGPILGFSLGTVMQDRHLIVTGVLSEVVGVLVTFFVGFLYGIVFSGWQGAADFYGWPTGEMASRGEPINLFIGFLFAVPSGVGVSLACTQGGVNTLVGVAIAASLLPPICNCGLTLAFGIMGCSDALDDNDMYDARQFLKISGISFALFVINVVSIYLTCILFFWAKQIKPIRRQMSRYQAPPAIRIAKKSSPGKTPSSGGGSGDTQHVVTVTSADLAEAPKPGAAVVGLGQVKLATATSQTTEGSVGGDSKVSDAKSSKNWEKVKQAVKEKQHLPADVLHESDETPPAHE